MKTPPHPLANQSRVTMHAGHSTSSSSSSLSSSSSSLSSISTSYSSRTSCQPPTGRQTSILASGHRRSRCVVGVLLLTLTMLSCVEGIPEKRVQKGGHNRYHVRNKDDAMFYLQKYGYLEHCIPNYRHPEKEPEIVSVHRPRRFCSPVEEKSAMKSLQETFDLPQTGKLDRLTRKLMETRRCGNSDSPETMHASRRRRKRSIPGNYQSLNINDINVTEEDNYSNNTWKLLEQDAKFIGNPREQVEVDEKEFNETSIDVRRAQYDTIKGIISNNMANNTEQPSIENDEPQLQNQMRQQERKRRRKRSVQFDWQGVGSTAEPQASATTVPTRASTNDTIKFRWRLLKGMSNSVPEMDQKAALLMAFRMWTECVPIQFLEQSKGDFSNTDIFIAFAKRQHMNCDKPFDGFGGELAHSWSGGDIHFDADEKFQKHGHPGNGVNLMKVAIHEVGHVLGLLHNEDEQSVMYPIYVTYDHGNELEISEVDRKAVQSLFGICKGTFDAVFDWVVYSEGKTTFSSYFFRGNRFWIYINKFKRPMYGALSHDINATWPGLPSTGIDAFLQPGFDAAYFFAGDKYYKIDGNSSNVSSGYPRNIADDFTVKAGIDPVPENLDATFDLPDRIYLLKGEWVWICHLNKVGQPDRCYEMLKFSTIFITNTTNAHPHSVNGNVSSIFYSYFDRVYYLLKDTTVYEMRTAKDKSSVKFVLTPKGDWWEKWLDICEASSGI